MKRLYQSRCHRHKRRCYKNGMVAAKRQGEGAASDRWPREAWSCGLVALVGAAVMLLSDLSRVGVVDPYELRRAELARRLAVALFDAESLARAGDPAGLPTLGDLGAGELGFTSMAAGFALFGAEPWAGRLPLALWCLLGAMAVYGLLARHVHPRAGLYAALSLVTMPGYFMQAKVMLGDAPAMAGFALALAGLGGALVERRSARWRAGQLALGGAGLLAGFLSRGALLGVAAPLGAVGVAWAVMAASPGRAQVWARPRRIAGVAALAVAGGAALLATQAVARGGWGMTSVERVIGAAVRSAPPHAATFDLVVRDVGHAFFPWSALVPLAAAQLLAGPSGGRPQVLRLVIAAAGVTAFLSLVWLAPYCGRLPFIGASVLAHTVGVAAYDLDRGAASSPVGAVVTAGLGALLWYDLARFPQKRLAPLAIDEAALPAETFTEGVSGPGHLGVILFLGLAAGAWMTRRHPPRWSRRYLSARIERHRRAWRALAGLWRGNLLFAALLLEATLVGVALMLAVGRWFAWPSVVGLGLRWAKLGLNAWWVLPLGLATVPLGFELARWWLSALPKWVRGPRAAGVLLAAASVGGAYGFGYYPRVMAELSPKGALDVYAATAKPGEPLALLALSPRAAWYHGARDAEALTSAARAFTWLVAAPPRRFLAFRDVDLPVLNARFRERYGRNLPVLSTGSILLASNQLGPNDNLNPLAPFVLAAPPQPMQHPIDAALGSTVKTLGWEVVDPGSGEWVDHVVPGRTYRLNVYYRVRGRIRRTYDGFIHVDAPSKRHNGDHALVYPTTAWRPGDVIRDGYDLTLLPDFPPGRHRLYFGLYRGRSRLPVTAGSHRDDRVEGGTLEVR